MEKKEYGYINALKGIAIMGVTLMHVGGEGLPGFNGNNYDGARSVQMFFLISAILAFSSLTNSFSDRIFPVKGLVEWYVKKAIRLVPLYYLAILISMLTKSWNPYWLGTEKYVTVKNLIAHFFLVHGFFPHYTDSVLGVDWYLGCLWIFLLLTPFLYKIINSLKRSIIFISIVYVINPFLNHILKMYLPVESDPIVYEAYIDLFGPFSQLLIYSIGIVLYYSIIEIQKKELRHKVVISYTLLMMSIVLIWGGIDRVAYVLRLSRFEMIGILFGIIILSQSIYPSVLIDNPFFRLFGKYSYGIYLFQFIWIYFYERHIHYTGPQDWIIKYMVSLVVLLIIAVLANIFFEKPVQKKLGACFKFNTKAEKARLNKV